MGREEVLILFVSLICWIASDGEEGWEARGGRLNDGGPLEYMVWWEIKVRS